MSLAGYASPETLEKTMRKLGSQFQGHPHREFLPALETSSGPLGSGLSQLVGMALAQRMDFGKAPGRFFYCLLSDAEMEIGETYEAMMLAGKERIGNIITVVDRNNIQIDGYTEDIMPIEPVLSKWKAFNWHVREVDGHNFQEIDDAIREARSYFVSPSVIVMHTIPGKGVKEFEGKFEWHGKVPNKDEAQMALKELQSIRNMLKPKK
jgi:transketolase